MDYSFIEPSLPAGDFRKCFALSVHKCGSTLMHNMIMQVCQKASIPHLNITAPLFNKGIGREWLTDPDLRTLITDGYIYCGFREFTPALKQDICEDNTRSVLLVRDPRDALVSQYFSLGPNGSHAAPTENPEKFNEIRARAQTDISIDQYVLKNAQVIKNKFSSYIDNLNFSNVRIFRYEGIFFDKYDFLRDIFRHFDLEVEDSVLKLVAEKNDVVPSKEDPSKHIRKGLPGDHKEKLAQSTIDELNLQLNEVASFYGYQLLE